MNEPTDKFDRVIHVGDFIVYGHALGRSAALKIGRVLEIKRVEEAAYGRPPWRIRVAGYDEGRPIFRAPSVSHGTLQFPDRMIVVREADVPAHIRSALS